MTFEVTLMSAAERVQRLQKLLFEAYSHYFQYEKAAIADEGTVTVSWPTFRSILNGDVEPSVTIVSSVFGDGNVHVFETLDDAVMSVERWHFAEMANEPETDSWFKDVEEWD